MVQVGEEESESGFRRVVSCMMEAAAESPRGQAAFQAGRALRNLSYSDGGLRWHLHSAGAMDAVEALLKGAAKPAESTPDATAPPAPSTEAIRFQVRCSAVESVRKGCVSVSTTRGSAPARSLDARKPQRPSNPILVSVGAPGPCAHLRRMGARHKACRRGERRRGRGGRRGCAARERRA